MRISRTQLKAPCKHFFQIECQRQQITAYGGLELIRRYFHLIGLRRRIQRAFQGHQVGGDYSAVDMVLVHLLRVKNRPGNVHDSKGAVTFLRELMRELNNRLHQRLALEFRMDGAFFQAPIIDLLEAKQAHYAIKVPFHKWLGLVPLIRAYGRNSIGSRCIPVWAALSSLWTFLPGTESCVWWFTASPSCTKPARIINWICSIPTMATSNIPRSRPIPICLQPLFGLLRLAEVLRRKPLPS